MFDIRIDQPYSFLFAQKTPLWRGRGEFFRAYSVDSIFRGMENWLPSSRKFLYLVRINFYLSLRIRIIPFMKVSNVRSVESFPSLNERWKILFWIRDASFPLRIELRSKFKAILPYSSRKNFQRLSKAKYAKKKLRNCWVSECYNLTRLEIPQINLSITNFILKLD